MTTKNEKYIRTIQFSGGKKIGECGVSSFSAKWKEREYKKILLGNKTPPPDNEGLDLTTDEGKTKLAARKENDKAYHDLVLANQTKVAFKIIDKSISSDFPNRDALTAWKNLKDK